MPSKITFGKIKVMIMILLVIRDKDQIQIGQIKEHKWLTDKNRGFRIYILP